MHIAYRRHAETEGLLQEQHEAIVGMSVCVDPAWVPGMRVEPSPVGIGTLIFGPLLPT